jgi:iturin family lipopeptide synthetase A
MNNYNGFEIAVIGMSGRFPGARDVNQFWQNIKDGKDSISRFTEEELAGDEINSKIVKRSNYIKAKGIVEDVEYFDASFFGYTPKEALIMDPQIRLFHECTWEAFEDAGYNPFKYTGIIGVFAGAADSLGWKAKTMANSDQKSMAFTDSIYNSKDYLSTRISYCFDLKGPSTTVANACSTSLVAMHMACRSLLSGDCDMAIAGGVTITFPNKRGYLHYDGLLYSKDGYIRTFDAEASGTVFSDGVGVVVLKPLADAIRDRDNIHAVIKGSSINNDGNRKGSFSAPSEEGQAALIKAALHMAEIEPETMGFIEAHGTGTLLGDPVELKGLEKGYVSDKKGFCAIGSVKPNIGHLDAASGVAGFIKAVMALKHKQIPPNIHFNTLNPNVNLENTPFYVNTELKPWPNGTHARRAGVNSFGVGGTNVHIIVEEFKSKDFPELNVPPSKKDEVIVLSAKTSEALTRISERFLNFLKNNPSIDIAHAAYTLQLGRAHFPVRKAFVAKSTEEAIAIQENQPEKIKTGLVNVQNIPVVFMFPGQGSQYVKMGYELYITEPYFKNIVDECFDLMSPEIANSLKDIWFDLYDGNSKKINRTENTQPLIFVFEYALARLLMNYGITPNAMIGHSIGEYVAACISGVIELKDALKLVIHRGRLMESLPSGGMLSISIFEEDLMPLLSGWNLEIAAVNSSSMLVVAGAQNEIDEFQIYIENEGYKSAKLHTSHAFHSRMMEPILDEFARAVGKIETNAPSIPYISNQDGNWIEQHEVNAQYWATHLRNTVRFSEGLTTLCETDNYLFLEVGPGKALSTFLRQHEKKTTKHSVFNTIRHPNETISDSRYLKERFADLWVKGIEIDWFNGLNGENRNKISLPAYSFDKYKFWIEGDPFKQGAKLLTLLSKLTKKDDVAEWVYIPQWSQSTLMPSSIKEEKMVFFAAENDLSTDIISKYDKECPVVTVYSGFGFSQIGENKYQINPKNRQDYITLFQVLKEKDQLPERIVHLWSALDKDDNIDFENVYDQQYNGCYSVLYIVQALDEEGVKSKLNIEVITSNVFEVTGNEKIQPGRATVTGIIKTTIQEFPHITARHIDVSFDSNKLQKLVEQLIMEIQSTVQGHIIAYRNNKRWVQVFEQVHCEDKNVKADLRENGVYLLLGGLGSIGLVWATFLAENTKAKLILTARSSMPERETWDKWLAEHPAKDRTSAKIRKIRELERIGAEVLHVSIDIADEEEMVKLIADIESRYGQLNGVVNCAGVLNENEYVPIIEIREQNFETQFWPKMKGLFTLEKVLKGKDLDFCAITSSIASVLSGTLYSSYTSANIFMDAFVQMHNRSSSQSWVSINWDLWNLASTEFTTNSTALSSKGLADINPDEISITGDEGKKILPYILKLKNQNQIAISISDLQERITWGIYNNSQVKGEQEKIKMDIEEGLMARPALMTEFEPPQNEIEVCIIKIFTQLFGVKDIGRKDDFFELGGDSIKAIGVMADLNKMFKINLSIREFFNNSRVNVLASFIESNFGSKTEKAITIPVAPQQDLYLLSSAQSRLFIIQQMFPESVAYNEPYVEILYQDVDLQLLRETIKKQIERNEVFRTSFVIKDGVPYQQIAKEVDFDVEYWETSEENVAAIIKGFIRPFDLSRAPLLRIGVIKLAEKKFVFLTDFHHIITDLTSLKLFWNEHNAILYKKQLPAINLSYKDYSEWENSEAGKQFLKKQEAYWLQEYSTIPQELVLPYDFERPEILTFKGGLLKYSIDENTTAKIKSLAIERGATLYSVLFATYSILMSRLSGQDDIVVGSIVANRWHQDLQNIMGMFVNTLAIRTHTDPERSFKEYLDRVKDKTLKSIENQSYPFEKLVEKLKIKKQTNKNMLFNVEFTLQNVEIPSANVSNEGVGVANEEYNFENRSARFDLTYEVREINNSIEIWATYSKDVFKEETIRRFNEYYQTILKYIINNSDIKIKNIKLFKSEVEEMASNELADIDDF